MADFEVEIEKIVAGGDGLGRHEGRVVFVPKTAPGERHRVEIVEQRKDYLRGRSVSRLESSVSRRDAPCRYDERCGGCSLMHLTPPAQLEVKKKILLESLARSGASSFGDPEVVVTASPEQAYRTRLRFHISSSNNEIAMGFRRRGSHVVEDVEHCHLAGDELNECWRRIRGYLSREPEIARDLISAELQESGDERGRIIGRFLVRSRDGFRRFDPELRAALVRETALEGLAVVSGSREARAGRAFVHHRVAGVVLRQSSGAFFQTNRFLVDNLVAAVDPVDSIKDVSRVVDLYCGVGLFAIPLSRRVGTVVGVEASPIAVRDGVANAQSTGVNVRFSCEDASRFAAGFGFERSDYVVVDPPRGGLPRELRQTLSESPIRELCYVSCDPAAFARDATFLCRHGFRLRRLQLLDFFPNTHHFETVAAFSRSALDSVPREG